MRPKLSVSHIYLSLLPWIGLTESSVICKTSTVSFFSCVSMQADWAGLLSGLTAIAKDLLYTSWGT